jgi:hypothetical protein
VLSHAELERYRRDGLLTLESRTNSGCAVGREHETGTAS